MRRIARDLLEREVQSVAVCLLNSYANGVNERRVKQILEKEVKGLQVTLSSDIAPQIREYPRTSTTSIKRIRHAIFSTIFEWLDRSGQGER